MTKDWQHTRPTVWLKTGHVPSTPYKLLLIKSLQIAVSNYTFTYNICTNIFSPSLRTHFHLMLTSSMNCFRVLTHGNMDKHACLFPILLQLPFASKLDK